MKTLLSLFFVVLFAIALAHKPEDPAPGIIDVTAANEAEVFDGSKHTFVEFYAPWCGHCKNLAPEYHKLGEAIEKQKPADVRVAKVNCVDQSAICSKNSIQGYPTLKFYPKGSKTPEDYNSGRTAEDIAEYLNKKAGSRIRIIKAPEAALTLEPSNFDEIIKDTSKNILVKFYAPWCGHCKKLAPTWEKLAKAFENEKDVIIAKLDADKYRDLAEPYNVRGYPTIKFFPKGADRKPEDYNSGRDIEDLVKFLNNKAGTHRTSDGQLDDEYGLEESLTKISSQFLAADESKRAELLEEAKNNAKSAKNKKAADYYIKTMEKVIAKGDDYVQKEKTRLTKIMSSGNVAAANIDNFKLRLNILNKF
jgi:protein disulfide-isomerase A6